MSYYSGRMVYRYFSKLDETRGFDTADDAREFDRIYAVERLHELNSVEIDSALHYGDPDLVRLLRFAADEIADAPIAVAPDKPETP